MSESKILTIENYPVKEIRLQNPSMMLWADKQTLSFLAWLQRTIKLFWHLLYIPFLKEQLLLSFFLGVLLQFDFSHLMFWYLKWNAFLPIPIFLGKTTMIFLSFVKMSIHWDVLTMCVISSLRKPAKSRQRIFFQNAKVVTTDSGLKVVINTKTNSWIL